MSAQETRVGDVVRLKSGGPPMTVEGFDSGSVRVVWIDDRQQTHRETFPPEALQTENGSAPMRFR